MNTDNTNAPDIEANPLPPLPGGGSWRWTGTKWIPSDSVEADPEPEPQPTKE